MPGILNEVSSVFEQVRTWETLLAVVIAGLFGVALRWLNLSQQRWKLRSLKHKSFRDLVKKDGWRKVSPYEFHAAMQDAFGRSIDPSEFAFIQTRTRPLQLMKTRFAGGAWVRFDPCELRYDWIGQSRKSAFTLRLWGALSSIVGICLLSIALPIGITLFAAKGMVLLPVFMLCVGGGTLAFVSGTTLDAAARLLDLEKLYPKSPPVPDSLPKRARIVPKKTRTKTKAVAAPPPDTTAE